MASVLKTEKPVPSQHSRKVARLQSKFALEIRAMLEGHAKRNVALYLISRQSRLRALKLEQARRAKRQQGGSDV
jgi:hypothetical protein